MILLKLLYHPYQEGNLKKVKPSNNNKDVDAYEIYALAKRLGITKEEMESMSFVSLMNILISSVDAEDDTKMATQEDIDRWFK